MGIDSNAYNFIRYCSSLAPLGDVLTLGRQQNHLRWSNPATGDTPYFADKLLSLQFGAGSVASVDASSYESPTFVHDLNLPLQNSPLSGQSFDTVIDCGTLEHVFNVPLALQSVASLCRIDGSIIHVLPHTDSSGHGFWQFSPELFFSWYSQANGFADVSVYIAPTNDPSVWFECTKPSQGRRLELTGRGVPCSYILVRAVKIAQVDSRWCYQSDYLALWHPGDAPGSSSETLAVPEPHLAHSNEASDLPPLPFPRFRQFIYRFMPSSIFVFTRDLYIAYRSRYWYRHPFLNRVKVSSLLDG